MNKFYITNAIPYVNARPHIGHALEFIQSDTIARYYRYVKGIKDTVLSCGYDENSLKNVQAAEAEGISVNDLVEKNGKIFHDLWVELSGKEFDTFVKGSSSKHIQSSQELWKRCFEAGDIYKKAYEGLYCVGCEQFYEKKELNEKGECSEHPGKPLEKVSEENWFFRLKGKEENLKSIIKGTHPKYKLEIVPKSREHEVLSFLERGLEDISISRSNERAKNWGVPVPGDDSQRMYVWFDALNIYQTAVGFPDDKQTYEHYWPADLHVVGKGIIRFHAVYWPAFLLSAGLKLPKKIFVHEYFTVNGQKMSKTLGNVIDPLELIEKYGKFGTDALRYYCLAKFSPFQDGDFSEEKFKEVYNADLANGLGNLVARVAKLCENRRIVINAIKKVEAGRENEIVFWLTEPDLELDYRFKLENFQFNEALSLIWKQISELDRKIEQKRPWEAPEKDKKINSFLADDAVLSLRDIARLLKPFLPKVSTEILNQFKGPEIKSTSPLFPRI